MILIEGIPWWPPALAAEQKAKDWLAETKRRALEAATQRPSVGRTSTSTTRAPKAA
jgi:hypothetical protein